MQIIPLASGSGGNCIYVPGDSPFLLEAGIPWRKIQQGTGFKTAELDFCLVTHGHMDHAKSVTDAMKAGIDCYMSAETIEALGLQGHRAIVVQPKEQFRAGKWDILPFDVKHDAPGTLGFLLTNGGEKLIYITDTPYCKYTGFTGLTRILIECNYSLEQLNANVEAGVVPVELRNRIVRSHMSLETCKAFLLANDLRQVREIHLLHLSGDNSDAELFKREIQKITGKETYIAG
jgi:phosphoribosyl 1,2-cyclic phosphodiesterase